MRVSRPAAGLAALLAGATLAAACSHHVPAVPGTAPLTPTTSGASNSTGVPTAAAISSGAGTGSALSPSRTAPFSGEVIGLSPTGVTFVSADEGWMIGTQQCADLERCTRAEHTTDGGATWSPVATPPGTPTDIRFATASIGYAYGRPDQPLDITTDGGASWRAVRVPDAEGGTGVIDLEVADGIVWALGQGPYSDVLEAPVGTTIFHKVGETPNRTGLLSLHGTEAYVLGPQGAGPVSPGLSVATTTGETKRAMPCSGQDMAPGDAGALTPLLTARELVLACVDDETRTPSVQPMSALFRSTDDGLSWTHFATLTSCAVMSLSRTSTAAIAGCSNGLIERVDPSTGAASTLVKEDSVSYVGFTNDSDGVALIGPPAPTTSSEQGRLLITRDGGAVWTVARI